MALALLGEDTALTGDLDGCGRDSVDVPPILGVSKAHANDTTFAVVDGHRFAMAKVSKYYATIRVPFAHLASQRFLVKPCFGPRSSTSWCARFGPPLSLCP